MSGQDRIGRRTPVRDVQSLLDSEPIVVHADLDLIAAARRATEQPATRVLAVVDDDGRLIGVIPVQRIVEELVARASPEDLMAEITDLASAVRFGREIGAKVCGDLMSEPVAVHGEATIADAFHQLKAHHYSGLPIIDAERRVVGYLDILELALRHLDALPAPDAR